MKSPNDAIPRSAIQVIHILSSNEVNKYLFLFCAVHCKLLELHCFDTFHRTVTSVAILNMFFQGNFKPSVISDLRKNIFLRIKVLR